MTMSTLVGRVTATNGHQNGATTARPQAALHPLHRITPIGVNESPGLVGYADCDLD